MVLTIFAMLWATLKESGQTTNGGKRYGRAVGVSMPMKANGVGLLFHVYSHML